MIGHTEKTLWLGLKGYKKLLRALGETKREAQSRKSGHPMQMNKHNQCLFHICKIPPKIS